MGVGGAASELHRKRSEKLKEKDKKVIENDSKLCPGALLTCPPAVPGNQCTGPHKTALLSRLHVIGIRHHTSSRLS